MFKIFKEEIDFGGKKLILETGKVARQADGAVIAKLGETVVLSTAVGAKKSMTVKIIFFIGQLPRKILCCWENTRRIFKREARPLKLKL